MSVFRSVVVCLVFSISIGSIHESYAQNLQASARLLALDFNRESKWDPLNSDLNFPSGGSLFLGGTISRYLTLGGDLRMGKVNNAQDELIIHTDGETLFSLNAALRLQNSGSRYWVKPFIQVGAGAQLITNEDGVKPEIYLGGGLDIKIYKNIYLNLGSSFTREISRIRYFLDYGVGITFALMDEAAPIDTINMSVERNDFDSDGLADIDDDCPELAGTLAAKGCPDKDGDGVPDHLDNCPFEAGIEANDGCPMHVVAADFEDKKGLETIQQNLDKVDSEESNLANIENLTDDVSADPLSDLESSEVIDSVERTAMNASSKDSILVEGQKNIVEEIILETDEPSDLNTAKAKTQLEVRSDTSQASDAALSDEELELNEPSDDITRDEQSQQSNQPTAQTQQELFPEVTDERNTNSNSTPEAHIPQEEETEERFVDTDKDGIADHIDPCPLEYGSLNNSGCPDNKEEKELEIPDNQESIKDDFSYRPTVLFQSGLASLDKEYIAILDEVADFLNQRTELNVNIRGHTDTEGSESLNDFLSKRRAKACYLYLKYLGINPMRLSYEGRGEVEPTSDNLSSSGRRSNRRVEFHFYQP